MKAKMTTRKVAQLGPQSTLVPALFNLLGYLNLLHKRPVRVELGISQLILIALRLSFGAS